MNILLIRFIYLLVFTIFIGCASENELEQYDGKILYVNEEAIVMNYSGEMIDLETDIIEVEYYPKRFRDRGMDFEYLHKQFKESLVLNSLTGKKNVYVELDAFERFINRGSVREATINEIEGAKLCNSKKGESKSMDSVKISGETIRRGDLPRSLFRVIRPNKNPTSFTDPLTSKTSYVHTYIINGIKYKFTFKRTGPITFRIEYISVYSNHSLNLMECIEEYISEVR